MLCHNANSCMHGSIFYQIQTTTLVIMLIYRNLGDLQVAASSHKKDAGYYTFLFVRETDSLLA